MRSFEKRQRSIGYVFIAPFIAGALCFLIFPVLFSLALSFSELQNVVDYRMRFVGLENYARALWENLSFLDLLWEQVQRMLIDLPLILIFSVIMGVLLSRDIRARGLFRMLFFLPVILGAGYVMQQLLGQNVDGESMELVRGILLPPAVQVYLGDRLTQLISGFLGSITTVMWRSGVQILLVLGGIQSISPALYESARIDTANEWDMFWKITLPMLTPTLLIVTVYTIVDSFADAENPMLTFISEQMFTRNDLEYASATGWLYFAVVLVFVAVAYLALTPAIRGVSEE